MFRKTILFLTLCFTSNLSTAQSQQFEYRPIYNSDEEFTNSLRRALEILVARNSQLEEQSQRENDAILKIIYEGFDVVNSQLKKGTDKSIIEFYEMGYEKICRKIDTDDLQSVFSGKIALKKLISSLYNYSPEKWISPIGRITNIKEQCALWDICDFTKSSLVTMLPNGTSVKIKEACKGYFLVELVNGEKTGYISSIYISLD
jgi:hypothetical protein